MLSVSSAGLIIVGGIDIKFLLIDILPGSRISIPSTISYASLLRDTTKAEFDTVPVLRSSCVTV